MGSDYATGVSPCCSQVAPELSLYHSPRGRFAICHCSSKRPASSNWYSEVLVVERNDWQEYTSPGTRRDDIMGASPLAAALQTLRRVRRASANGDARNGARARNVKET